MVYICSGWPPCQTWSVNVVQVLFDKVSGLDPKETAADTAAVAGDIAARKDEQQHDVDPMDSLD